MYLICKLIGHDFVDRRVVERRNQRSGATVLTVREFATCRRCGGERILYTDRGLLGPAPEEDDTTAGSMGSERVAPDSAPPSDADSSEPAGPADTPSVSAAFPGQLATDGNGTTPPTPGRSDRSVEDSLGPGSLEDSGVEIIETTDRAEKPDTTESGDTAPSSSPENQRYDGPSDRSRPPSAATSGAPIRHRCPKCGFEVSVDTSPYMAGDICSNCRDGYIERVGGRAETVPGPPPSDDDGGNRP